MRNSNDWILMKIHFKTKSTVHHKIFIIVMTFKMKMTMAVTVIMVMGKVVVE